MSVAVARDLVRDATTKGRRISSTADRLTFGLTPDPWLSPYPAAANRQLIAGGCTPVNHKRDTE